MTVGILSVVEDDLFRQPHPTTTLTRQDTPSFLAHSPAAMERSGIAVRCGALLGFFSLFKHIEFQRGIIAGILV